MNGPVDHYRFKPTVPPGDNRQRMVCHDCGWINYVNPKVIVGAVCTWHDRVLLCKRAIEPRSGFWTIPAGFLEEGESAEDGASREAMEEAGVDIEIDALLGVYSIPRISQVHLIYRAVLRSEQMDPGPESLETRLWTWEQIPWNELAFPTVHWALGHFAQTRGADDFQPFTTPAPFLH